MHMKHTHLEVVCGCQVSNQGALDACHTHSALAGGGAGVDLVADLC